MVRRFTEPDRAGLLQVDQAGLEDTIGPLAEEYMLRMKQPCICPAACSWRASLPTAGESPGAALQPGRAGRQPGVQVLPTVQGTGQEDRLALSADRLLGEERRLQGGNAKRPVALDVAGTRGRRSARPADGAGCGSGGCSGASGSRRSRPGRGGRRCSSHPFGIRFVHSVQLQGPQGVEAVRRLRWSRSWSCAAMKTLIRAPRRKPPPGEYASCRIRSGAGDGDIAGRSAGAGCATGGTWPPCPGRPGPW